VARVWSLVVVVAVAAVATTVALAAPSPQQWRAKLLAAVSAKHSVHYVSANSEPGVRLKIVADVGRGRGIQRIRVTKHGQTGPATVLVLGQTAYIRGNAFTLHKYFPFKLAQATRYAGQWISIPSTFGAFFSGVAADATFASFVSHLLPAKRLALVRATIGGRKSVGLKSTVRQGRLTLVATVYAPAAGPPLPFAEKVVLQGKPATGAVGMSGWNEPLHLMAPAHAVPISSVLGP
jgi:hypothetical protein